MGNAGKVAAGAAVAAAVGGLAYFLVVKAKEAEQVAALRLSASNLDVSSGVADAVTVEATDSLGNPVPGVGGISLLQDGTALESFPKTDANGNATLQVTFPAAGTYDLQAVLP